MSHNILELTTLSDTIYSKKIWVDPSRYQVGYELVTTVEKANELVTKPQDSKIYMLKYSHVAINGEVHPLERIDGYRVGRYNEQIVKLLFKCEHKEVSYNGWLQWEKSYY